jgi:hypothetical protein
MALIDRIPAELDDHVHAILRKVSAGRLAFMKS